MSKDSLENLTPEQKRQLLAKLLQEKANQPQHFPLSFAQKRLWFLDKLQPESSAYNIPAALHLTGELNIICLQQSLNNIIQRHEVLRSSFTIEKDEPIQQVFPKLKLQLPLIDLQALSIQQQEQQIKQLIKETATQPFDLSQTPLFRTKLIKLNSQENVLLFTMHHIISDYFSMRLLIRELAVIYQSLSKGETLQLPELSVQYGDYATWEQEWLKSEKRTVQLEYWQKNLANYPPLLTLPTDYPRPPIQRFHGARKSFALSQDLSNALKNLSQGQNSTLFMTLLAGFKILLYRYSNQEDILIGSTITNRENRAEISNLIGLFVNNLIFRTNLSGNPSFSNFLQQVREVTLNAYANQDLPYEYLVEQLQPERNLSYNPLFQVMFILHNTPTQTIDLSGLSLKYLEPEHETSRFDLSLDMYETASGLTGIFEYNTDLFAIGTIERIIGHFQTLLTAIVANPEQNICKLPLLTPPEEQQLLIEWNNTSCDYSKLCIHQLFEVQAEKTPDKIATVFESQQFTYKKLNQKANQLARYLKSVGVEAETRVGICLERSEKMLVGLLGILKAGGTYIPLDPAFPEERLRFMVEDSGVDFFITDLKTSPLTPLLIKERGKESTTPTVDKEKGKESTTPTVDKEKGKESTTPLLDKERGDKAQLYRGEVINLDNDWESIEKESSDNLPSQTTLKNLAYIIYTSGSTGKPKGVQIFHSALVNCLESMQKKPGITSNDILLSVTTLSFDIAGLELYLPLITGACLIIASRETATDGKLLKQSLADNQVTIMQATPATWRLLLTSGWKGNQQLKILCGGEALDKNIAEELLKRSKEVWNLYGPTEATIWSSVTECRDVIYNVSRIHQEDVIYYVSTNVPIGKPISNTQFYVLNDYLQPVPIGVPGQLYIGGAGLAKGYLNKPQLTTERFIDNPFFPSSASSALSAPFASPALYKTGDLVRYLPDGNLEYLGRIDYQVKLRGFRIELGEIESVLIQHPSVKQVVVTLYKSNNDERLIAYVVPSSDVSQTDLRQFLQGKLPSYMIPSSYMMLEEFPLTPNRKIDRKALPNPEKIYIQEQRNFVAPRNPVEEILVNIWSEILGIEKISVDENFFEIGGHSLLATRVISQIREVFEVELPLRKLFENPTIAGIAETISINKSNINKSELSQPKIEKIERQDKLPISFAQQRQWFLSQLEPESPFYNIPAAIKISAELDILILERCFQEIINRHEVLRTAFLTVEGKPVAQLSSINEFKLSIIDLNNSTEIVQTKQIEKIAREEAQQPFQLDKPPLLRVKLIRLNSQNQIIFITLHHIVADAWSMGVLIKEIALTYQGYCQEPNPPAPFPTREGGEFKASPLQGERFGEGFSDSLPELPIQYADFAAWQQNWFQGKLRDNQLNYWLYQLKNAPNLLELSTDYPRPAVQTANGGSIRFELPYDLSQALKQLSQKSGCTLFMTLLAAFQTLLYRYSGNEDIVVGSAIANRQRSELEGLIGCFANTLAFRSDLSGNPSFSELLQRVKDTALGAYAHQDLPFEQLVDELQLVRSLSYTPLFQVMFLLQNAQFQTLTLEGLSWSPIISDSGTAKFDLTLSMSETANGLIGSFEYNRDLFAASTIERMIGHWQILLQGIVANPQQKLYEFPLLTTLEQQLFVEWNQTHVEYPQTTIHQLFAAQVEKTPNSIAIVWENQQLTYQELDIRSNQLARYLIKLGIKPEKRVGICVQRRIDMVIGLLGILKAGGAYVPLDPAYPQERLTYMLADAGVSVILTDVETSPHHETSLNNVVNLTTEWNQIAQENSTSIDVKVEPENLAYIIYTSGSTGKPKGVAITHRSATTLIHWSRDVFTDTQIAGVLASTSICFDLSVFELFVPLSWGGKVILAENALQLPYLNTADSVTLINTVPSAIAQLSRLKAIPNSVNTINLAGEALQQSLVEQLEQNHPQIQNIYNLYGPSEDTTYSTYALVYEGKRQEARGKRKEEKTKRKLITNYQSPPIGYPITNTQTYILDTHLQQVPIGVPGELYLAGSGLMRGYLNRPELTAEKLIPNPFSSSPSAPPAPSAPSALYKTGDKARYLANGNIEYLGRLDNQVKLRGFRIELGEIESVLNQHPQVYQAVTKVWEDTLGNKRLVAYFVLKNPVNQDNFSTQLRRFIQEKLPDYMIPAIFMMLSEMPLTPNGKINRRALPEPDKEKLNNQNKDNANYVKPRTLQEELLAQIWSKLLGVESVGIHNNFFELGGDSILGIQVIAKASQAGLRLLPKQVFQHQTIAELAAVADTVSINAEQGNVTGILPLTPIQHWFFAQNLVDSHHWNQSIILEIDKSIPFTWIEQSIQKLLVHHDALRLQFRNIESGVQQINADVDNYINKQIPLLQFDLSALNEEQQKSTITKTATQLQTSLNLATGLVRVGFFQLGNEKSNRLLFIMHHLVIDGISWRILLSDLQTILEQFSSSSNLEQKIQLPPKTTSFKIWANSLQNFSSQISEETIEYWQNICQIPKISLPVDYPQGNNTVATTDTVSITFTVEETQALLQQVPYSYQTQINDVLLTALVQTFENWTGEKHLLIDLEGHGREDLFNEIDISRTVGWFTTIFPVWLDLGTAKDSQKDIISALKIIKEQLRQIPNKGIDYGILRYLGNQEIQTQLSIISPQIRFNYLGQVDGLFTESSFIKPATESTGVARSKRGNRDILIEINSIISAGKLRLDWIYSQAVHHQNTIINLSEQYKIALSNLIQLCSNQIGGYTPSDFPQMELSQDELDDILEDL